MGTLLSRVSPVNAISRVVDHVGRLGRKRKHSATVSVASRSRNPNIELCDDDERQHDLDSDEIMCTPKKKKLNSTTDYIYTALFVEQRNSDVAVRALGKVWNLHKIYLCQSPYFASLFSGSWRERASDAYANVEVVDPQVTLDGLDVVFGSLYNNEVTIDPKQVVAVLAAATLFQLEGLIERCGEVMVETITAETVIGYHDHAVAYGLASVAEAAIKWLLVNLLMYYKTHPAWLRRISIDLMTKLIEHEGICLVQTECAMYYMLRQWMYLRVCYDDRLRMVSVLDSIDDDNNDDEDDDIKDDDFDSLNACQFDLHDYFYEHSIEGNCAFLLDPLGVPFQPLFKKLRYEHMLCHPSDLQSLFENHIVPHAWLYAPLLKVWNSTLRFDQSMDRGLSESSADLFRRTCNRFGRYLESESPAGLRWRWTGFSYGLDLVMVVERRSLLVRRNHRADHERLLSLQPKRGLVIRATINSLNKHGQVTHTQTTEIKELQLERNAEQLLIEFDAKLHYPMVVLVEMLQTSYESHELVESLESAYQLFPMD